MRVSLARGLAVEWRQRCWRKPALRCWSWKLVPISIRRKAICSNGLMILQDGGGVLTGLLGNLTRRMAAGISMGNLIPGLLDRSLTGSGRVCWGGEPTTGDALDRKSTRLNSSH